MLTRVIRILAAVASLGVMVHAGVFQSNELILAAAGFAAWACVPYVIAWFAAGRLRSDVFASGVLVLGLAGIAGLGLYAYTITFIYNSKPDAQDGLVFIFVPLYQLGAMLLTCALAFVVRLVRRRYDA